MLLIFYIGNNLFGEIDENINLKLISSHIHFRNLNYLSVVSTTINYFKIDD